jgi:hypothetical protein
VFEATNDGTSACTLPGAPTLTGTRADGSTHNIRATVLNDADIGMLSPVALQPGDSVRLPIGTIDSCPAAASAPNDTAVNVTLPAGPQLTYKVPSGIPFSAACGVSVGSYGIPTSEPLSPLDALQAQLLPVPSTSTVPGQLEYQVRLSNPTTTPILLSPCPSYTESLGSKAQPPWMPLQTYELNCLAAPSSVPAGGFLVFMMEGNSVAGSGTSKLGWVLNGTGVSAGTPTRVG